MFLSKSLKKLIWGTKDPIRIISFIILKNRLEMKVKSSSWDRRFILLI